MPRTQLNSKCNGILLSIPVAFVVVIGVTLIAILGIHAFQQWYHVCLPLLPLFLRAAYNFFWIGGIFQSTRGVRIVRMGQVKLTVPEHEQEEVIKIAGRRLKDRLGRCYEMVAAHNDKCSDRVGKGFRSSWRRATPVVADLVNPDRFWCLENSRVIYDRHKGFRDLRVYVMRPEDVNDLIATQIQKWRRIRIEIAKTSDRNLAKKFCQVVPSFTYPKYEFFQNHKKLELCLSCPVSTRVSRKGHQAADTIKHRVISLDDLESEFQPFLEEAHRKKELRRELKVAAKASGKPKALDSAGFQSGSATEASLSAGESPNLGAAALQKGAAVDQKVEVLTCNKGHDLRPYVKQIGGTCDSCSGNVSKREKVWVCVYFPSCTFIACCKCKPTADFEDTEESLCICCLDASAEMVMESCGHLVFCRQCCHQMVAATLGVERIKDAKAREIERTKVICPMCREASVMIKRSVFHKRLFSP